MSDDPDAVPLILTDFSKQQVWADLHVAVLAENAMGFRAYVRIVANTAYSDAAETELRAAFADRDVIFAVDSITLQTAGWPILCVDPADEFPSFRACAEYLWVAENNISTGNMLFEELAGQFDNQGKLLDWGEA